ncbi:MAG: hypothetical protein MUO72_20610 [Bacteroidales bacterium]|nr:hypothetical protein [Bacteroidales bacterium]
MINSSTGFATKNFTESYQKADDSKRTYQQKLESSEGINIYKYVLLINIAALEGYVLQARLQAQQSFNLSRIIAITGFIIVGIAIILSIILTWLGNENLNAAYLAGIAGVLTEFIAGVFFLLYSKTLGQINIFHDKLVDMQKTALNHMDKFNTGEEPASPESDLRREKV